MRTLFKTIIAGSALTAASVAVVQPAQARDHTGTAVAAGIIGLGIGAAIASSDRGPRYSGGYSSDYYAPSYGYGGGYGGGYGYSDYGYGYPSYGPSVSFSYVDRGGYRGRDHWRNDRRWDRRGDRSDRGGWDRRDHDRHDRDRDGRWGR